MCYTPAEWPRVLGPVSFDPIIKVLTLKINTCSQHATHQAQAQYHNAAQSRRFHKVSRQPAALLTHVVLGSIDDVCHIAVSEPICFRVSSERRLSLETQLCLSAAAILPPRSSRCSYPYLTAIICSAARPRAVGASTPAYAKPLQLTRQAPRRNGPVSAAPQGPRGPT